MNSKLKTGIAIAGCMVLAVATRFVDREPSFKTAAEAKRRIEAAGFYCQQDGLGSAGYMVSEQPISREQLVMSRRSCKGVWVETIQNDAKSIPLDEGDEVWGGIYLRGDKDIIIKLREALR